jgi:peptidoglycan/LPS O-acetylase OafA/YrhL
VTAPGSRIPSLDGLRAISILFVVLGHLWGTRGYPLGLKFVSGYSYFGVHIFFVISGFLITKLLLSEHQKTGEISLKKFYARRALRIFPAAYVFILTAIVVFHRSMTWINIGAALTYMSNFDMTRPWVLGHLWSLAVEEQFYLLWPAVLLLFFSKRTKILLVTIIATPFIDCVFYYFHKYSAVGNYFPTVADSLAMGCLLAVWEGKLDRFPWLRSRWILLIGAAALYSQSIVYPGRIGLLIFTFVVNPFSHLAIALTIYNVVKRAYRPLNWQPVVWLGTLSYSLYLWQQPFLDRYSTNWICAFPQNIVAALVVAAVCHYLIEKPFLRLRDHEPEKRVQQVASASA